MKDIKELMAKKPYATIEDIGVLSDWPKGENKGMIIRHGTSLDISRGRHKMTEQKIRIKKISLIYEPDRRVEVELSTGSTVIIERCHESWQQWGGTKEEL